MNFKMKQLIKRNIPWENGGQAGAAVHYIEDDIRPVLHLLYVSLLCMYLQESRA